jgi:hypothetical protein
MAALTTSERDSLARTLEERKTLLREEIRRGLARMGNERYVDLLSGTSDAGDESVAMLLTDVANAEVARDAAELRDIVAAEGRIAAGTVARASSAGRRSRLRVSRHIRPRSAVSAASRSAKRPTHLPDAGDRASKLSSRVFNVPGGRNV